MLIAYLDAIGDAADQVGDPAQHPDRLLRARGRWASSPTRDGRAPGGARWPAGLPRGPGDGHHLRPAAGQRPHLELRGQQLADGRGPAGLRHPGLERRLHPHAGGHALVLPAHLLPGEPAGAGRDGAGRASACTSTTVDPGPVPGRGRDRPHRPVDLLLQHHPAGQGRHPVRAQLLGPHRRHRQPAQPQGAALDQRRHSARPRRLAGRGRPSTQAPGGRTGSAGPRPTAASAASPRPWAATATPPSPTPRAATSTRSSPRGRSPGGC